MTNRVIHVSHRPRMEKSHLKRHELPVSRADKLSYPTSAGPNHKTPSKRRVRTVSNAIFPFFGGSESVIDICEHLSQQTDQEMGRCLYVYVYIEHRSESCLTYEAGMNI